MNTVSRTTVLTVNFYDGITESLLNVAASFSLLLDAMANLWIDGLQLYYVILVITSQILQVKLK